MIFPKNGVWSEKLGAWDRSIWDTNIRGWHRERTVNKIGEWRCKDWTGKPQVEVTEEPRKDVLQKGGGRWGLERGHRQRTSKPFGFRCKANPGLGESSIRSSWVRIQIIMVNYKSKIPEKVGDNETWMQVREGCWLESLSEEA